MIWVDPLKMICVSSTDRLATRVKWKMENGKTVGKLYHVP